jgi:integral membrane protein
MKLAPELVAYRVMAWITGVWLLALVFVAMPLKYFADKPGPVAVIGTVHGFLYMVYVVTVLVAAYRRRWPVTTTLLALLGGVIPFASFLVERHVIRKERARLAAETASA